MARNFIQPSVENKRLPRFELTALIDVIFILLIFFAVSSSFHQQQRGLKLTLPSAIATQAPKKSITISIDRQQRVYWNGTRISESGLATKIANQIKQTPNQAIMLQADKATPYVRVVNVLDAIRQSGGQNVMLQAQRS
ncbi:MAG: ExbD/TolR family protein [Candidatus Marinamargulisbacteria bacterium]